MSRERGTGSDTLAGAPTDIFEHAQKGGLLEPQKIRQAEEMLASLPEDSDDRQKLAELVRVSKEGLERKIQEIADSVKDGIALLPQDYDFLKNIQEQIPQLLEGQPRVIEKMNKIHEADAQKEIQTNQRVEDYDRVYKKLVRIVEGSGESVTDTDRQIIFDEKKWRIPRTLSPEIDALIHQQPIPSKEPGVRNPVQFIDKAEINAARAAETRKAKEAPTQVIPAQTPERKGLLGRLRNFFTGK